MGDAVVGWNLNKNGAIVGWVNYLVLFGGRLVCVEEGGCGKFFSVGDFFMV